MMTVEPARTNLDNEKGAETPLSPEELARREAYALVPHSPGYPFAARMAVEYARFEDGTLEGSAYANAPQDVKAEHLDKLRKTTITSLVMQLDEGRLIPIDLAGNSFEEVAESYLDALVTLYRTHGTDPFFDAAADSEPIDTRALYDWDAPEYMDQVKAHPHHVTEVPSASLTPEAKKTEKVFKKIARALGEKVFGLETTLHSGEIEILPRTIPLPTLPLTTLDKAS